MSESRTKAIENYFDQALEGMIERINESEEVDFNIKENQIDLENYYQNIIPAQPNLDTPGTYQMNLPYRIQKDINGDLETDELRLELDVYNNEEGYRVVPKQTKRLKSKNIDDKTVLEAFEEELNNYPEIYLDI